MTFFEITCHAALLALVAILGWDAAKGLICAWRSRNDAFWEDVD